MDRGCICSATCGSSGSSGTTSRIRWATARFVVFYLICGLAAALTQVLMNPASLVPMVGASGAISGIMGAYLVLYPRVRVYCACASGVFHHNRGPARVGDAWLLDAASVLRCSAIPSGAEGGGVAFWAHVGGFFAGVILIKLFARRDYIAAHEHTGVRGGLAGDRRIGNGETNRLSSLQLPLRPARADLPLSLPPGFC